MQDSITAERLAELRGETVYDPMGEKIGKVEEIFYDGDSGKPEWLGIGMGLLGSKRVLVPVGGVTATGDGVTVVYAKDMVKGSPAIHGDEIGSDTEQGLHQYYGLAPHGTTGTGLEQAVTRSEEELRVGKRSGDAGSVRLRKWVETEPVQTNISLTRETVHVSREPIDQVVEARAETVADETDEA